MVKRKRRYRTPAWRKWARTAIGLGGAAAGAAVAFTPTYRGLGLMVAGDFKGGAAALSYDTTGLDPNNPSSKVDVGRVVQTGLTVGVGIGLMWLFRKVARRI